jgi:hypothetical protein
MTVSIDQQIYNTVELTEDDGEQTVLIAHHSSILLQAVEVLR